MPNPEEMEKMQRLSDKIDEITANLTEPVRKKMILCLDFDGVCSSYLSGWKGAAVIPDLPVDGLFEAIKAYNVYFDVQVFSSRSNQPGGIDAMQDWFLKHWQEYHLRRGTEVPHLPVKFPTEKPPAFVSLDDRTITFTGIFPDTEMLLHFKPWNKWNK